MVGVEVRLFYTTTKGYMGWIPDEARQDDLIGLLFGGHAPFVLRPIQDGTYRMLGACYVHGIMRGEAMGSEEWIEENAQEFTVRLHCEWP
jgi:hypothetical protein